MLKTLRKSTKVVIWTVVISFALWGGFSVGVQFQKQGRVAGEVFGKEITFQEFNRFYKSQQLFSFGDTKAPADAEALKQRTWESLIYSREAKREKIQVSDDEVRGEILRLMSLQKIENPSVDLYKRWLQATAKSTPDEFESIVRELLRIQKLVKKIKDESGSAAVTEQEAEGKFLADQTQVSADVVTFKGLNTAYEFSKKAGNAKAWGEEIAKQKLKPEETGFLPVTSWVNLWGIAESQAQELLDVKKDDIRGPYNFHDNQYAVMKITGFKAAPKEEFQKEKEKYLQEMKDGKAYEKFAVWHRQLMQRANLKDYMNGPSPARS